MKLLSHIKELYCQYKTEFLLPRAGLSESVYPSAHSSAVPQSGNVYQRIYDANGNELQKLPGNRYPSTATSADWYVNGQNGNKVVIQTLP
ncbi:hypothetical protein [Empedobacter tilapiae]|uniref:hypothetical protein n=1 Tax=Empedobacter tilapiae TaxID=2491114 RepID=UPI0028D7F63B|nr:hypothetical protein [Empedobacter tilapiae]